ncbi:MAG: hypothetical protein JWN34_267 [Bryobacterales bacterium]|nr:hypothetical protein [Bryobacterales bacterium]
MQRSLSSPRAGIPQSLRGDARQRSGEGTSAGLKVPALVFKIGSYPIHHGVVGIVRSLGRMQVPVYVVIEDRFAPVAHSRYLTDAFIWNNDALDSAELLTGLEHIGRNIGVTSVLITTDDRAARFVAENAPTLRKWFLCAPVAPNLPRRLINKWELYRLCRENGVPCPDSVFPESMSDVLAFIEGATFPVVVKAVESERLPSGIRGTSLAHTPAELIALYRRVATLGSPNLIFQAYIPEDVSEDWIVHGYANPGRGCMVTFTGRKFRSFPAFAGITTMGVAAANRTLRLLARSFAEAIGYAGAMDLDYRLDGRDSKYKLLDFNPRIGANFRMFEDSRGTDIVRALYLDLTGETVDESPALQRTFVVECYDLFMAAIYMRHGVLSFRSWWTSLRAPTETAWFDALDPLPFLAMWLRLVSQTLERAVWRRLRGG